MFTTDFYNIQRYIVLINSFTLKLTYNWIIKTENVKM